MAMLVILASDGQRHYASDGQRHYADSTGLRIQGPMRVNKDAKAQAATGLRASAARYLGIRSGDFGLVLISSAYFFCLLSAYYTIRPIREEVGVAGGVENIPLLFTATLAGMLVAHPIFAAIVSRWPRRRFVTATYRFFMANLVIFFVVFRILPPETAVWAGRTFFVWTSIFNMFVVSVFWSFMTDIFRETEGRRLFGIIGVGGTLGAIAGSAATAFLAPRISLPTLLWLSVALIECAVLCVKALDRRVAETGQPLRGAAPSRPVIGGLPLDGVKRVLASPYLMGICLFMFLFTTGSTFLYQMQADIMGRTFLDPGERTSVFAQLNLAVNIITLFLQLFLTGRLLKRFGVGVTLSLLPLLSAVGFVVLGTAPVFAVFAIFQVLRRAGEFALARPAREVLYTALDREDKYKAKNFIDTFVYRAGDQIGAWSYAGVRALGTGMSAAALAMAPVSAVWLVVGLWLGRKHKTKVAGK